MICGNKVVLRALEPTDLDHLYAWENDPDIWHLSSTTTPFSRHTLKRYIESVQDIYTDRQLRLMIVPKESTDPVGCIDLFDFDPLHKRAGIGILIARPIHRHNGLGSDALKHLISYAFDHLGLHQLHCNVLKSNEASLGLFRKLGFSITAEKTDWIQRDGVFENELLLQLMNPAHG